ncbi:hypothetical protein ES708_12773 [subsurface metagenome]
MKLGKIEKEILRVLAQSYPEHSHPVIISGRPVYGYPKYGSDTKHLARAIFGDHAFSHLNYLEPKVETTLSRALNNLRRKGRVKKLHARGNDPRLRNTVASTTEFPHGTKFWWILNEPEKEG